MSEFIGNLKVNGTSRYEKCYKMLKQTLQEVIIDKPKEIYDHKIFALSYFFDKSAEAKLIDSNYGGTVIVNDFKMAAKKNCETAESDRPFLCLDLTYISTLLEIGFDLKPNTEITLLDTIEGHEISWALGAAYYLIEDK